MVNFEKLHTEAINQTNELILYMLFSPVRVSCWLLLKCMGWKGISEDYKELIKAEEKFVVVFSHTSYWDFWLALFHMFAYPQYVKNVYTTIKPQVFEKWYGPFFWMMNFIPSTPLEDTGYGFVQNVITQLRHKDNYVFMISPEGTLKASSWRSGYYYIAAGLNVPIVVLGFDYEFKELIVGPIRYLQDYKSKDNLEYNLQHDMSFIVPLHKDGSYVQIREHNDFDVAPFDPIMISNVVVIPPCVYYLSSFSTVLFLQACMNLYISLFYHSTRENSASLGRLDFGLNIFFVCNYIGHLYLYTSVLFEIRPFWWLSLFLTLVFYVKGQGRHYRNNGQRYPQYLIYHSLFHLCVGFAVCSPFIDVY